MSKSKPTFVSDVFADVPVDPNAVSITVGSRSQPSLWFAIDGRVIRLDAEGEFRSAREAAIARALLNLVLSEESPV